MKRLILLLLLTGAAMGQAPVVNLPNGIISAAAINAAGSGYAAGDQVLITGGNGLGELVVMNVSGGAVTEVYIWNAGDSYTATTGTATTAQTGSGMGLTVDLTVTGITETSTDSLQFTGTVFNTDVQTLSGTKRTAINPGTGLQAELDAAHCGDTVQLNPGTYTSSTNVPFVLHDKTAVAGSGHGWIYVESTGISNTSFPAEHNRIVNQTNTQTPPLSLMAVLTNSSSGNTAGPGVLQYTPNAVMSALVNQTSINLNGSAGTATFTMGNNYQVGETIVFSGFTNSLASLNGRRTAQTGTQGFQLVVDYSGSSLTCSTGDSNCGSGGARMIAEQGCGWRFIGVEFLPNSQLTSNYPDGTTVSGLTIDGLLIYGKNFILDRSIVSGVDDLGYNINTSSVSGGVATITLKQQSFMKNTTGTPSGGDQITITGSNKQINGTWTVTTPTSGVTFGTSICTGGLCNPAQPTGVIATATVNNKGSGYTAGNVLTLTGGNGAATVTVDTVTGGQITTYHISAVGANYIGTTGNGVTGGSGSGATFNTTTTAVALICTTTNTGFAPGGGDTYWASGFGVGHAQASATSLDQTQTTLAAVTTGVAQCSSTTALTLYNKGRNGGSGAAATTLGSGGSSYAVNDTFAIGGTCTGTVAKGVVDTISGSAIATYHMTAEGTGYTISNGQATTKCTGSGTGATINVLALGTDLLAPGEYGVIAKFIPANTGQITFSCGTCANASSSSDPLGYAVDYEAPNEASTGIRQDLQHSIFMSQGSSNIGVIDSAITHIHAGTGSDSNAFMGVSTGVIKWNNNYIEPMGEGLLFGGGGSGIYANGNSIQPANIEVQHNWWYTSPNLYWSGQGFGGNLWHPKDAYEMKTGSYALFNGNITQNSWESASGDHGNAIRMNSKADQTGSNTAIQYVTMTNNDFVNCDECITTEGFDNACGNSNHTACQNFGTGGNLRFENNIVVLRDQGAQSPPPVYDTLNWRQGGPCLLPGQDASTLRATAPWSCGPSAGHNGAVWYQWNAGFGQSLLKHNTAIYPPGGLPLVQNETVVFQATNAPNQFGMSVTNGGSGYVVGDTVLLDHCQLKDVKTAANDIVAKVASVNGTAVTSLTAVLINPTDPNTNSGCTNPGCSWPNQTDTVTGHACQVSQSTLALASDTTTRITGAGSGLTVFTGISGTGDNGSNQPYPNNWLVDNVIYGPVTGGGLFSGGCNLGSNWTDTGVGQSGNKCPATPIGWWMQYPTSPPSSSPLTSRVTDNYIQSPTSLQKQTPGSCLDSTSPKCSATVQAYPDNNCVCVPSTTNPTYASCAGGTGTASFNTVTSYDPTLAPAGDYSLVTPFKAGTASGCGSNSWNEGASSTPAGYNWNGGTSPPALGSNLWAVQTTLSGQANLFQIAPFNINNAIKSVAYDNTTLFVLNAGSSINASCGQQVCWTFNSGGGLTGLPSGISGCSGTTNTGHCEIKGTSSAVGTYTFTITATDGNGHTYTAGTTAVPITMQVTNPLAISPFTLPNGTAGTLYTCLGSTTNCPAPSSAVTGGTAPYGFSVSGGNMVLCDDNGDNWNGLCLDPSLGAIVGTPGANGTSTDNYTVTDSNGGSATASGVTLTIGGGGSLTLSAPACSGTYNTQVTCIWTATGGTPPYTFTAGQSGSCPESGSITNVTDWAAISSSGSLTGTPNDADDVGKFNFNVCVTDSAAATVGPTATSLTIGVLQITITPSICPALGGTIGGAVQPQTQFIADGGVPPYSFSLIPSNNAGITIDGSGNLIGNINNLGTYTFTVSVGDSVGTTPATESCTLTVSPITGSAMGTAAKSSKSKF